MKSILLAATATLLIGACTASPSGMKTGTAPPPPGGMPAGMQAAPAPARGAAEYMAMAASGDLLEIQSSQLLLQRSQDARLRAFAQQMTQDHPRLSQALMTAARNGGLTPPPPALGSRHAAMLKTLEGTPAAQFDAAYLRLQVMAHQEALMLHKTYAASGDNASLKAAAASAVPVVQGHLQHAQGLAGA